MSVPDISGPSAPISSPSSASTQITLQVGEQRFTTTTETLTAGSPFFSALLSGRWNATQADGSYFIDADPSVFKHILCYLRHGVTPIFYSKLNGHDHAAYFTVLAQARYFQVTPLEKWLEEKRYLQAIKIMRSCVDVEGTDMIADTTGTDVEIEYYPSWKTKRIYVCPRGINLHRDNPSACGRMCRKVQGDEENVFVDEQFLNIMVVRKTTVLDTWKLMSTLY